jgi:NADPH:quinone reductase-like Zn-dependent oxidoreductase
MKAIRMHSKGGPELLAYEDAPKPQLQPGDALVRVSASSITKTELTWSETYTACDGKPRLPTIPGHEFSGVVDEITSGVTDVKVGEAVYGLASFCRDGSAAEYIAIRAADLAPKPKTLDHVQAASIPVAALTAWQALFDHASVAKGKRVLIHGAAGGVGVFAVQIANWTGAEVIATASASNHDFLGELGADQVIDYTKLRFEDEVEDLDMVLDTMGGDTLDRSYGVLRRGGTLVSVAAEPSAEKAKEFGVHAVFFIVEPNRTQLMEIVHLIDAGKIRPVLDTVLPLDQARQAFERGLTNHARGKIVLRIAEQAAARA